MNLPTTPQTIAPRIKLFPLASSSAQKFPAKAAAVAAPPIALFEDIVISSKLIFFLLLVPKETKELYINALVKRNKTCKIKAEVQKRSVQIPIPAPLMVSDEIDKMFFRLALTPITEKNK